MTTDTEVPDNLLHAYTIMLHEVAGYDITQERLEAAMPLIRHMIKAIRMLDEVDVSEIEPMVAFKCLS